MAQTPGRRRASNFNINFIDRIPPTVINHAYKPVVIERALLGEINFGQRAILFFWGEQSKTKGLLNRIRAQFYM